MDRSGSEQWVDHQENCAPAAADKWALGTHLATPRLGYEHHGIYAGRGRIIHYAGLCEGWKLGPVQEVTIEQFACGQPVYVILHPIAKYRGADAVRRARSRLGENRYSLWRNNCEHLCNWSYDGEYLSEQVIAVEQFLAATKTRIRHSVGRFSERIGRAISWVESSLLRPFHSTDAINRAGRTLAGGEWLDW